MLKEAILHIPDSNYAFTADGKTVVIRLRTKKGDVVRCTLCYGDRVCPEEPAPVKAKPMRLIGSDSLFDYYECKLTACCTRIFYYFTLEDKGETTYYYSNEFHVSPKCGRTEYYQFAYVRREDAVHVPSWVNSAIIYQIFPDSFATERRHISGKGLRKTDKTGSVCISRNGGTLKGIIESLDYLVTLGANCIYLNPIFSASSYHKYDTTDYFSIDPCFGTEEDLKLLVSECHKNKIRVILDGVFNHCGSHFFAFQDVLANGRASRYADWFYRLEFPVRYETPPNYEAFAYVREMPKLNTGNPEVAEYLCRVGKYWIQTADIDGWRLDVANEINHGFWRRFRETIKAVKPDAFLVGEIWEDASQWLQGDQFDSSMNYGFSVLCRDFFANRSITTEEFDQKLHAMLFRYKTPIAYAQMNLLDSHDVPRFLSVCNGNVKKLRLALFFMMTFLGVPSILYGDEAEIDGVTEEDYRKPMPWENQPEKGKLFQFIQKLIMIRKQHEAMTCGEFRTVPVNEPEVYAFFRKTGKEKLLIVLNNSDTEKTVRIPFEAPETIRRLFPDPKTKDQWKGGEFLSLDAMEGKILQIQ
ncbi:Neopullulanase [Caprobacter fermentans]|uniref:Neopullulanase n=1 Tax=Caproicibacter fermentans TaxID=2576756 RepID=A0A6N8I3J9_9FIRM|nr:glycoside hydrolase family 13 protein [Caproicibacter fermentans]MVB12726.1 Neopullulanase [Caproicibacter fermentans]OCN02203.1 alpha-glycosidase [Clostridium sp. W14A]